jgi:hypothetical protein
MKYIKVIILCKCGREIHLRPSKKLFSKKGSGNQKIICPFCHCKTLLTRDTKMQVLCHTGTHDIVVFDDHMEANDA